ncbi:MAG: glycosyltransferase 87 family protein [Planctomycetota bacterium]
MTTFAAYADIHETLGAGALYTIDPALVRSDPYYVFAHPPPVVHYIGLLARLRALGVPFPVAFRLIPSLVDIATAALVLLACRARGDRRALLKAAIVLFSPALVLVSGFHGNTDSLLVFFTLAAVLAAERERGLAAGVLLALATSVKLSGLLVAPAVFLTLPPRKWFDAALGLAATLALAWGPTVAALPPGSLEKSLAYASTPRWWGISSLLVGGLFATEGTYGLTSQFLRWVYPHYFKAGKFVVVLVAALASLARGTRGVRGAELAAASILAFLALTPGFGPQYLAWPGALLAVASARRGAIFAVVSGTFLLLVYREWSFGELGYASSWAHGVWIRPVTDLAGFATWALSLVGSIALLVRKRP